MRTRQTGTRPAEVRAELEAKLAAERALELELAGGFAATPGGKPREAGSPAPCGRCGVN